MKSYLLSSGLIWLRMGCWSSSCSCCLHAKSITSANHCSLSCMSQGSAFKYVELQFSNHTRVNSLPWCVVLCPLAHSTVQVPVGKCVCQKSNIRFCLCELWLIASSYISIPLQASLLLRAVLMGASAVNWQQDWSLAKLCLPLMPLLANLFSFSPLGYSFDWSWNPWAVVGIGVTLWEWDDFHCIIDSWGFNFTPCFLGSYWCIRNFRINSFLWNENLVTKIKNMILEL